MWKNRSKPIADLSVGSKSILSFLASPIFPALHALDDYQDFKELWRTTVDSSGKRKDATKGEIAFRVATAAVCAAAWLGIAGAADAIHAHGKQDANVLDAVSKMSCKVPEGQARVVCGVQDIPALKSLFSKADARRVVVIAERKTEDGLKLNGEPARQSCETVKYMTVSPDAEFIGDDAHANTVRQFLQDCKILEL